MLELTPVKTVIIKTNINLVVRFIELSLLTILWTHLVSLVTRDHPLLRNMFSGLLDVLGARKFPSIARRFFSDKIVCYMSWSSATNISIIDSEHDT